MKLTKPFLLFLSILLTSCDTTSTYKSTSDVSKQIPISINSKTSESTSESSENTNACETNIFYCDDWVEEFDDQDNGNYYFNLYEKNREAWHSINDEYVEFTVNLGFWRRLKTYEKYMSIQYTFYNHDLHMDPDPEPDDPKEQGTPFFIQKQTEEFYNNHFFYYNNYGMTNSFYDFDIKMPIKQFLEKEKESEYRYVFFTFCEFAEEDGYTYTDGVKDQYLKDYTINSTMFELNFKDNCFRFSTLQF